MQLILLNKNLTSCEESYMSIQLSNSNTYVKILNIIKNFLKKLH